MIYTLHDVQQLDKENRGRFASSPRHDEDEEKREKIDRQTSSSFLPPLKDSRSDIHQVRRLERGDQRSEPPKSTWTSRHLLLLYRHPGESSLDRGGVHETKKQRQGEEGAEKSWHAK